MRQVLHLEMNEADFVFMISHVSLVQKQFQLVLLGDSPVATNDVRKEKKNEIYSEEIESNFLPRN